MIQRSPRILSGLVRSLKERLHPDALCAAVLVILGILFFADPLFSSKNFFFRDILNFHYPLRRVLVEAYARGEFPLWNPFIYLGQPMLANPNYMAFYPTNLLHLFLPFNYAFKLHFILHPILAGLGLYFFLRRLRLDPWASLAGAIAYQFSGTLLSFLNLYNIIPAVALLPWIAWAFAGVLERPGIPRILLLGAVLAAQVVAFEPLMFMCEVYLLAGVALHHFIVSADRRRAALRILGTGLAGCAVGAGLAAVQILPTLELLPLSGRGGGFDFKEVTLWSVHPIDLLNTMVPNLFGNYFTIGLATSWGEAIHNGREAYLLSFFLGCGVLTLAAMAAGSRRRSLAVLFAAEAALGLTLSLGIYNPVYAWLWKHVPLLQFGRYPSKYFLLAAFSVAVLAALGYERLFQPDPKGSRRAPLTPAVSGLAALTGVAFLAYWRFWPAFAAPIEAWIRSSVGPELVATKDYPAILHELARSALASGSLLLVFSLLLATARLWKKPALAKALVLLAIAAELIPMNLRLSPLINDAEVGFIPEVNRYVREKGPPEPFRVVPPTLLRRVPQLWVHMPNRSSAWLTLFFRMSGQPFFGLMNGIEYSLDRTVDYLETREARDLWMAANLMPESATLTLLAKLNSPLVLLMERLDDPRARLLGSFETLSDKKLNVYWLDDTIARAYFVSGVEKAASHSDALNRFVRPDFPFGSTVVLEDPEARDAPGTPGSGKVRVMRREAARVDCEVDARDPGYLVLLESHYPGWRAKVDGADVPILRANYAFRAVAVPAGRHAVQFRFEPFSFRAGLAISILTGVAVLTLALRHRRRRRSGTAVSA